MRHWRFAVRVLFLASLALAGSTYGFAAGKVVFDVEYTRNGNPDEDGRNATQTYLMFFLSRLPYGEPQTARKYLSECRSPDSNRPCGFPEFFIQVQINEHLGEIQISGTVNDRRGSERGGSRSLEVIRVKARDLITDGMASVVREIESLMALSLPREEPARVAITCFTSGLERRDPLRSSFGKRPESSKLLKADVTSTALTIAQRLPKALTYILDRPGMVATVALDAKQDCASREALNVTAENSGAEAVLVGRVYSDDRSGVIIRPRLYLRRAGKSIDLPVVSTPRQLALSNDAADLRQLGTLIAVLLSASKRENLATAVSDGTELAFYLNRASESLSGPPIDYEAAEALLRLAMFKAPSDSQTYLLLASSLASRRQYSEAVVVLKSAIQSASENKNAIYRALADIAVRARNLSEARRVYEEARSENVLSEDEVWLGIAKTYLAARPPDQAHAMEYILKAATKESAFAVDAYALAGQIALSNNDLAKAEEYFLKGRQLSPNSAELISRLSNLYERAANEEIRKGSSRGVVEYLTKSIDVSPSTKKYYDRGIEYLTVYRNSEERNKGYWLAVADYQAALQIAHRDGTVLTQFPWLIPNLAETLIFDGKFPEAKALVAEFFKQLGSGTQVRSSVDRRDLTVIAAYLNAAAELLHSGAAQKETYLFEIVKLGKEFGQLSWSFTDMEIFLDNEYPKMTGQLDPTERARRVGLVKQWGQQLNAR
jgi:tetratricopeptide (TPR) repeat protein